MLSSSQLRSRFLQDPSFLGNLHPYNLLDRRVRSLLEPGAVILDAGCGRGAPSLRALRAPGFRLVGIDLIARPEVDGCLEIKRSSLEHMDLEDGSVDVAFARSVMEHLENPQRVYREIHRVMRPGGHFVFLTPNVWDYGVMVARIVPNRWHPWIVRKTEGRREEDTFPTFYRSNSIRTIRRLAAGSGFDVISAEYLGQYPAYLMFSSVLFLMGTAYEQFISAFHPLHFLRGWLLVLLRRPYLDKATERAVERGAPTRESSAP